ncbi:hypothetical protein [Desertibacillus haloalkaliphilus]|nr:hypothetical protein [Desertibacillus haloalkaliphilus]MBU8906276.1 hypothetical protein [Desertibacillus haloalkaliphilus]
MSEEKIIKLIQKELKKNPEVKNIDIFKKYKVPIVVIELFRRKIEKNK